MHSPPSSPPTAALPLLPPLIAVVNGLVTGSKWNLNSQIRLLAMDDPPETAGWPAQNCDHGFVSTSDYQTPDVIGHRDTKPFKSSASVSAGGTVELQWTKWPESSGPFARGPRSRDPRGWNYVFRHKTIGMYGKQDYPQCINIEITAD